MRTRDKESFKRANTFGPLETDLCVYFISSSFFIWTIFKVDSYILQKC